MSISPPRAALRPEAQAPVPLSELLGLVGVGGINVGDIQVTGITADSRLIRPGDLYVALPGQSTHGARFAELAVASGAVAVLTDDQGGQLAGSSAVDASSAPVIVVDDPRAAMAHAAAEIFGRPSEQLSMLAITGTNGKTTTSFLLEAALSAAGRRCGVIGTIGFRLDRRTLESVRTTVTTPESAELQALLAVMRDGGADSVVMEVSSHALALRRTDAIIFDIAAFTNFGRDHLDFHGTEEAYFEAKARLFTAAHTRHAVINIDDPRGRELAARVVEAQGIGLTTTSMEPAADYFPQQITAHADGSSTIVLATPDGSVDFTLGLPGDFNIKNAITALAMADVLGVDLGEAVAGLLDAQVPGRMQRVDLGERAPQVFVDFAHTPQAVRAALGALIGQFRVVVLGCGGDRDPDKRWPIGAAAVAEADIVIVTDDNPRTENPVMIRQQVLSGAERARTDLGLGTEVLDGGDRRNAIRLALAKTPPDGVLAILGKGHEEGQEVNGQIHAFSDVQVVLQEWAALQSLPGDQREDRR